MKTKNVHFLEDDVRQTWLHYYNDYLLKTEIITELEWRKMRQLIESKSNMKGA